MYLTPRRRRDDLECPKDFFDFGPSRTRGVRGDVNFPFFPRPSLPPYNYSRLRHGEEETRAWTERGGRPASTTASSGAVGAAYQVSLFVPCPPMREHGSPVPCTLVCTAPPPSQRRLLARSPVLLAPLASRRQLSPNRSRAKRRRRQSQSASPLVRVPNNPKRTLFGQCRHAESRFRSSRRPRSARDWLRLGSVPCTFARLARFRQP